MAKIYNWYNYFPTITVTEYMCPQCVDVYTLTFYANQTRCECPSCGEMALVTPEYINAVIEGDISNPAFWQS